MRIVLIYPPPWKIAEPGEPLDPVDGPPEGYCDGDLDPDFHQTPYGLFTLGAQALRAGHPVKVLNLSAYTWPRVEEILDQLDADLFGMSCWTANRRGVALVADAIRRRRPEAHIVVGGPHATPFATEMLQHYPAIDSVALGESEPAFLELIERLESGAPTAGIAGMVYRTEEGGVEKGPPRPAIAELDSLASPHEYFDTHIVMTSRGCPWQCTFCGAETTWGRGFRGNSVPYVLDSIESALSRLPVKMIQIKDDTFTANRKRAMQISRGIRERGLSFMWSCDTRVDVLSEELLREMRLAGCERLSLGVESGSNTILANINKKITADDILEATAMAKRYGIRVRFYMMLGNRGETAQTFEETLSFLARAKPHEYLFSCLSIYPGTLDFTDAEKAGWLDREVYFSETFQELKTPFDATPEDTAIMHEWFMRHRGIQRAYQESVEDCVGILERLGDHHAAHMDLGGAYFRAGDLDSAERHIRRALELGYPLPGLADNYLGVIAHRRGDDDGMMKLFMKAAKRDPQHFSLIRNVQAARRWFAEGGPDHGTPLPLDAQHEFQLLEKTVQPTLPGPLSPDYAAWPDPPTDQGAAAEAAGPSKPMRAADARSTRRHLKIV
jgi:anaerobic magnesium-protoporphyrin IX monomethyl ester cyclase